MRKRILGYNCFQDLGDPWQWERERHWSIKEQAYSGEATCMLNSTLAHPWKETCLVVWAKERLVRLSPRTHSDSLLDGQTTTSETQEVLECREVDGVLFLWHARPHRLSQASKSASSYCPLAISRLPKQLENLQEIQPWGSYNTSLLPIDKSVAKEHNKHWTFRRNRG